MKEAFKAALAIAFLLGAAATAGAVQLTVTSDLPLTYITQGSTASGQFDINPSLTGPGFSQPYNVTSGTMTFNFTDNYDTQTGYSSSSYLERVQACIGSWCYPTDQYRWVVATNTSNYSPYEAVGVSSAGMTATQGTSYYNNYYSGPEVASGYWSTTFLGTFWVQDTHSVCTSYWAGTCLSYTAYPVYTVNSTTNSGYTGAFSIVMDLNGQAISDLSSTGVLGFSLTGYAGDLNFLSASLDVTVDENLVTPPADPPASDPTASVPEPSTLLLLGSGVLGMVFVRRRGKR